MKKFISLFIFLLLVGFTVSSAQTVTLEQVGVAPRDVEDDLSGNYDMAYNGLLNVGVGTQMYLQGTSDLPFSGSQVWEVATKPAGSAADIGLPITIDPTTLLLKFTTDVAGTYVVTLSDGGSSDTLIINAAMYLGVKTGMPNCWMCHNDTYTKWEGTGHADMLFRAVEGTLSDHYASYCISCHVVGYDTNPTAVNDGFDDWDFIFPDSLYEGQYDTLVAKYPDAMARANIQCESCHGPGSGHNGAITDNKMVSSLDYKNCAYCHDSGTHHAFPKQWEHSGDDATVADDTRGFHGGHAIGAFAGYAGGRAGCAACHSGSGYVQWVKDGKPVDENGLPDDVTTVPPATVISCAVCHDPHDVTEVHQLRLSDTQLGDGTPVTVELYGTGAQCMECHRSRRNAAEYTEDPSNGSSHYGPHHGPQADMLIGANAPDYGIPLPSSPHAVLGNACVDCHMAGDHVADDEDNIVLVGMHSFNMNDAEGTDNVHACEPCHGEVGETFKEKKYYFNGNADHDGDGVAEGVQEEVHGMLEELAEYLPQDDEGNVDMSAKDNSITVLRGGYAYMWVDEDRSFGIHNPAYTVGLLKAAIESFKYGSITAGAIQSISDIPMDQGFQVRIVWTAFGADDGVALDQVKSYAVLRLVDDVNPAKSGNTIMLDDMLWDIVAEVPAIQFMEYSAVVPTLYNTVQCDTAMTTFKVVGKTDGGIVAETAPASGYSTDDLAPATPTNLSAAVIVDGVELMWDESADTDFNYFEIFRSETQGFEPTPEDLLATTTDIMYVDGNVVEETTYFYVITAKDFSGNTSEKSNQVSATITDVAIGGGIPTEYALSQNYPNPFNPSTAIKFAIPEAGNVKLLIYDSVGNEVAVLVNNTMSAGYYTFTWNATNYASGIYFYKLQSNNFSKVSKMLLIK